MLYSGNANGTQKPDSGLQNPPLFVLLLLAASLGWRELPSSHPLTVGTRDFLAVVLTLAGL